MTPDDRTGRQPGRQKTAKRTSISRHERNPTRMKILNRVMKFLVGRGSMADNLMVLHWMGKKSGDSYSTPVSRFEIDGQLFTQTNAGYKANFVDGGPAELEYGGKRNAYVGTVTSDATVVGERMRSVLDEWGIKKGSRALGLKIEGEPTPAELAEFAAADRAVVIDFTSA